MIPDSTNYKLVKDDIVVAEGSKSAMLSLLKKNGGSKSGYTLWLSPSSKIGDTLTNVTPQS